MKIETAKFKTALGIVKPALASKEIIEQTTSFAFIDNQIVAYNDEICIVHQFENLEIEGVIKAEELYNFLGKVKEKEFDVTVTENEIVLKAGRAKVGFALNKEILLPLDDELGKKGKWKNLPSEFTPACKFAVASASTDMSDPKLTCVHFNTENGVIEATNNHRLVVWKLKEQVQMPTTLIPASSIKEVIKIKPVQVATGDGWVHFKNETGTTISCRTIPEKFVETEPILKGVKGGTKVTFPDGLAAVIDKAEIFGKEQKTDGSITVEVKNGKLLVKSESETAWFKENIAFDGEEEFSFSITPYLLKDILKETNTCQITPHLLMFKNDQWVYLTSLRTYTE